MAPPAKGATPSFSQMSASRLRCPGSIKAQPITIRWVEQHADESPSVIRRACGIEVVFAHSHFLWASTVASLEQKKPRRRRSHITDGDSLSNYRLEAMGTRR